MANFVQFRDAAVARDPQFGGGPNDRALGFLASRSGVAVPGDFLTNPAGLAGLIDASNNPTTPVADWIEDAGDVRVMTGPELTVRDANLLAIRKLAINAEVAIVGAQANEQLERMGILDHTAALVAVQLLVTNAANDAALDALGFGTGTNAEEFATLTAFAAQTPARFVFGTHFQTTGVQFDVAGLGYQHTAGSGVFETPTNGALTLAGPTGLYLVSLGFEWAYDDGNSDFLAQLLQNATPVMEFAKEPSAVAGGPNVIAGSTQAQHFGRMRSLAMTNGDTLTFQFSPTNGSDAGVRKYEVLIHRVG